MQQLQPAQNLNTALLAFLMQKQKAAQNMNEELYMVLPCMNLASATHPMSLPRRLSLHSESVLLQWL